jgi:hypothetical protein
MEPRAKAGKENDRTARCKTGRKVNWIEYYIVHTVVLVMTMQAGEGIKVTR